MSKISKLKNQSVKVKISNLINYLTICCKTGKGNYDSS